MAGRGVFLSVAAGLFSPFPLLALMNAMAGQSAASGIPPVAWQMAWLASFLFAFGVTLWQPIHPLWYGAALAPGVVLWCFVMAAVRGAGNLFGLAVVVLFAFGATVGFAAALCGWLARRWQLPAWSPAALMFLACLLLVFGEKSEESSADAETTRILAFLAQVRDAEQSYAASRPDRTYTCNGPDLKSLGGIEWRTDYNLGGVDRNQGEYGRYWVTLRCPPSAHTTWITASAVALWPGGPRLTYDSRSGKIGPEHLR